MQEKLKSWLCNDQVFYGLLIIFVSLGSFSLGRLSLSSTEVMQTPKVEFKAPSPALHAGVVNADKEDSQSQNSLVIANAKIPDFSVVASKSGTKYHLPSCAGAKQIKSENLITFQSRVEAEKAGYTPAANCPALQ